MYFQLLALAKHHNKTPYSLMTPYMVKIAPSVVSTMNHRPNLLIETCRFMSLSPSEFLTFTSSHTLPWLFGTCNTEALRKVGEQIGSPPQSISSLFLNSSAEILSHVFSLSASQESDRSFNFIMRTLKEAANNVNIGPHTVIRSCLMPLLARLVVAMGDENRATSENVRSCFELLLFADLIIGCPCHPKSREITFRISR